MAHQEAASKSLSDFSIQTVPIHHGPWALAWAFFLVGLFGLAIGTSELVSRYKDSPAQALKTATAILYIVVNVTASLAALWLILAMGWLNSLSPDGGRNLILQCLISGFGAMAFFRTSLFTIRVGDADVAVGPAGFLQVILSAADRATDRARAKPRALAVAEIMLNISFEKAQLALPTLCFGLMQNVTAEEQRSFGLVVKDLQNANMLDVFKANNLGLALMNIVGEGVLRQAVSGLRRLISDPPKQVVQSIETLQLLKRVKFELASQLVDECLLVTGQSQTTGYRSALVEQVKIISNMKLEDVQKVLLLSAFLINEFSEDILQAVLKSTQNSGFTLMAPPVTSTPSLISPQIPSPEVPKSGPTGAL